MKNSNLTMLARFILTLLETVNYEKNISFLKTMVVLNKAII